MVIHHPRNEESKLQSSENCVLAVVHILDTDPKGD